MSDYIAGLLTLPVLLLVGAAVGYLIAILIHAVRVWWISPTEFKSKDWDHRTRHASCVVAARRVWAMKLPGSRLLVFRSTVGGSDYKYGRYYTDTNEIERRARAALLDEFDPRN
ncbi:hypothetical protein CH267_00900 [Rhodococcus sp. 06-621-2]|nr:hypothetical protein [Rhodococcus sp. 06-621-2]OZC62132.1 hypothetical protein CH267_00900 [Rhodococcus sp. 06-621-2]